MIKPVLCVILALATIPAAVRGQCNEGLVLGAVVVPLHGSDTNGGNFGSVRAWTDAARWVDSLKLDYRQAYLTIRDIDTGEYGRPDYNDGTVKFQDMLTDSSGNAGLHLIISIFKVGTPNTLETLPANFTFTSLRDNAYIGLVQAAIMHVIPRLKNVRWISIGNEIGTYFGGDYRNSGRLKDFTVLLDSLRSRLHSFFPNIRVGTIFALHNAIRNNELDFIDSITRSVDYVGYTYYNTAAGTGGDTCWGDVAATPAALDLALSRAAGVPIMITETCMGDGGPAGLNCGTPERQREYADTVLAWYDRHRGAVEGMTWFTITDPWLGWQTPNTLWNSGGLVDSSGLYVQAAGLSWNHICTQSGVNDGRRSGVVPPVITVEPGRIIARYADGDGSASWSLDVVDIVGHVVASVRGNTGEPLAISTRRLPDGHYLYVLRLAGAADVVGMVRMTGE